ncbi:MULTISPECIES: GntR family transcriptional regulator [unclassified Pandoraea]|uniref:GntR family transcriptional regulator n=1 Tax=unclassified Pandoraea TaxID=2624094 RepID=UPI000B3FABA0|nr:MULTISPECIES: GntR family transcriptional regulator [unclassified Pandoraea]
MLHPTPTTVQLREMILKGELAPGERLAEAKLAEQLGVSRMPIRQALPVLAEEGLVVRAGQRGYAVRAHTRDESVEALHLRGALEGYAARLLAEKGASAELLKQLRDLLAEGDALLADHTMTPEVQIGYASLNARFHDLLVTGARNPLLEGFIARCNLVPFVAPRTVAFGHEDRRQYADIIAYAHRQHHAIVEAIAARQPDRAEFMCREHIVTQEHSMGAQLL